MNTGRSDTMGNWGTSTSGVWASGYTTTEVNNTETWDGTSWSNATVVNTPRSYAAGLGRSNTDGIVIGGYPARTIVEQWDGSSWTEVGDLNEGRSSWNSSGTESLGIVFGGDSPPKSVNTELWNGTSWTELNNLSTGVAGHGGTKNGSANTALAFGGVHPPYSAQSEQWDAPSAVVTVTTS